MAPNSNCLNLLHTKAAVLNLTSLLLFLACVSSSELPINNSPVIGILAQEYNHHAAFVRAFPNHRSYIAASYVKGVESSGARVVPIFIGQTREYYAQILSHINGVLLPGGGSNFNDTNGYAEAARHLIFFANKMNENNEQVPIMAVCLGFEFILQEHAQHKDFLKKCRVQQVNLNLEFQPGFESSSLYARAPPRLMEVLASEPITHNNHIWCVTSQGMEDKNLLDDWNILTTSKHKAFSFVSSVEHKRHPIVGLQFHPEKNAFEWEESQHNPHHHDAIASARIFYDWFVEKARHNHRSFGNKDLLYRSLIENYDHVSVYPYRIGLDQLYLFK